MDRRSVRRLRALATAALALPLLFAPAAAEDTPPEPPPRPVIVAAPEEGTVVHLTLDRTAQTAEAWLVPGTTLAVRVTDDTVEVTVAEVEPTWVVLAGGSDGVTTDPEVFPTVTDDEDAPEAPNTLTIRAHDEEVRVEPGHEVVMWTVPEPPAPEVAPTAPPEPASSTDEKSQPEPAEAPPVPAEPSPTPVAPEPEVTPTPVAAAPEASPTPVQVPLPVPDPVAAPVRAAALFVPRVSGNSAVRQQDDLSPLTPSTGTNTSGGLTGSGTTPANETAAPAADPTATAGGEAGATGPLASTGASTGGPAGAGLLSILGGLLLVGLARRRTR